MSLGQVMRRAHRARLIRVYHKCLSEGGEEALIFEEKKIPIICPRSRVSTEISDRFKSHRTLILQRQLGVSTPTFVSHIAAPDCMSPTIIGLKPDYEDCTM